MKNIFVATFIFLSVFILDTEEVFADALTAPVVSIGVGNSNFPENTGPTSGSSYYGDVQVYATITDSDLDNYHFRVVKEGGIDGFTCTDLGALFAIENQGYASTTLSKDTCGFVFNQSLHFTNPIGFTNSLIATLNTSEIIAFGGEGDYWLILGAVDTAGNRTNSNYLNDAKVKITVTSTPVAPVTPNPSPVAPSGGGSNGPIVNSYGVAPSGFSPAVSANNSVLTQEITKSAVVSNSIDSNSAVMLADGGIPASEAVSVASTTELSTTAEESNNSNQLAQTVSSGFGWNWLWIILVIVLGGVVYYFGKKK